METDGRSREELINELKDLRKRLSELEDSTFRLKCSEEALRLDEARLEALLKLSHMAEASEQDIANFGLEAAISLANSEVGWIGALSEHENLVTLYNYSSRTMRECEVIDRQHSFIIKTGGIWTGPVIRRSPVIINDYDASGIPKKGFPEGHVPIKNFLAIPVFDGERLVAIAEVANKNADYDHSDVRQLTLLMNGVWRIILRKRTEGELLESKAQTELYVDLMGHDINNMNQIALGFLDMALEKLDKEKKLEQCDRFMLERPLETLKNSTRLISNVKKLQSAKKGGLKSRLMDLNQVLSDVIKDYSMVPGRDINIEFTPMAGCFILANDLIEDVFSNLIGNAIKHSSPDRQLAISIRVIRIRGQNEDYNVVMVEDNGPGIADEYKEAIFGRFRKGRTTAKGRGLGLYLVKTLVEDFHGKVWVEDRVAGDHTKGSRFVVMLSAM